VPYAFRPLERNGRTPVIDYALRASDVSAAFPEHSIAEPPLGEGGMKSAFRIRGQNPRVLKVVREPLPARPNDTSVRFPQRLQREIDGMRLMNNPSIVTIFECLGIREEGGERRVWFIEPTHRSSPNDRLG